MYTVLHIEQSEFFCKVIESVLKKKEYTYIPTDSYNEALRLLEEYDIDLIVTSLYGKGSTIEDFIKNINMYGFGEIPLFVVTSNTMDEKKKELINLGVSEYIIKEDLEQEFTNHIEAIFQEHEYMTNLKEAKIAVVEDSSFESLVEKNIFKKYGIENVEYYKTGRQLIDSGKKYDLYLIDIILKDEFGKDLIRKIRRNNINSSIIAVTGLDNNKTLSKILDGGADDIINKPIDENLFIAKLRSNIRIYTLNKKLKTIIKEMNSKESKN